MRETKERSLFIPLVLLVLGLLVSAGLVMTLLPLVECAGCLGAAEITESDLDVLFVGGVRFLLPEYRPEPSFVYAVCFECDGRGRSTLFRRIRSNGVSADNFPELVIAFTKGKGISFTEEAFKRMLESRASRQ